MTFEIGDEVVCLSTFISEYGLKPSHFTKGKTYIISEDHGSTISVYKDDIGTPNGWSKEYFISKKLYDFNKQISEVLSDFPERKTT